MSSEVEELRMLAKQFRLGIERIRQGKLNKGDLMLVNRAGGLISAVRDLADLMTRIRALERSEPRDMRGLTSHLVDSRREIPGGEKRYVSEERLEEYRDAIEDEMRARDILVERPPKRLPDELPPIHSWPAPKSTDGWPPRAQSDEKRKLD